MAEIPNVKKYEKQENDIHPRIAERRYMVQEERLVEGHFPDGVPVNQLLGDKWHEIM